MMEGKLDQHNVEQNDNPWKVSSIFDFHYFCCPECNNKSKSKQDFVDHASNLHGRVSWNQFSLKINPKRRYSSFI